MCLSTRCGQSRSAHRSMRYGSTATMPTRARRYTCPSTWSASTCCRAARFTARRSTCVSAPPMPDPRSYGPCRPTIPLCARRGPRCTTTPTTMTSTVRDGTGDTIRTSTITPTTSAAPGCRRRCLPSPTLPDANTPATTPPNMATNTTICLWWAVSQPHGRPQRCRTTPPDVAATA